MSAGDELFSADETRAELRALDREVQRLEAAAAGAFERALHKLSQSLEHHCETEDMHIFMAGALWARKWLRERQ